MKGNFIKEFRDLSHSNWFCDSGAKKRGEGGERGMKRNFIKAGFIYL